MNTAESNPPTKPVVDATNSENQAKESTSASGEATPTKITIEGITEPTVLRYFETMNAGDFEVASTLFAANGVMRPPFESEIEGPEAIAAYLHQEAKGMILQPREGIIEPIENEFQVQVTGKVQTSWCGVNVAWLFTLNQQRKIIAARIKLLASPQELINLRR